MRIGMNAVMLDGPRSGATRRIEWMAQALRGLGHEVLLYRGKDLGIPWRPSIARAAAERIRLPARIAADRLDVLEWSHLPLSLPAMPGGPKILLTIHDLRHLAIARHSPFSRRFFAKRVLLDAITKVHRVIAVSEFTKSELLTRLPIAAEKIAVVPNAADHFGAPEPAPTRKDTILYVGHLEPRKNLSVLIEALALLRQRGFPHRLQIAGAGKGKHEEELRARARATGVAEAIDWMGPVADDKLPELYASARVFALPSLYEGFGIPILEAMRCGTPVVAAQIPAFREVGAEACAYADPDSSAAWDCAIEVILRDQERWREMSEKGKRHADLSRWDRSAKLFAEAIL